MWCASRVFIVASTSGMLLGTVFIIQHVFGISMVDYDVQLR